MMIILNHGVLLGSPPYHGLVLAGEVVGKVDLFTIMIIMVVMVMTKGMLIMKVIFMMVVMLPVPAHLARRKAMDMTPRVWEASVYTGSQPWGRRGGGGEEERRIEGEEEMRRGEEEDSRRGDEKMRR